MFLDYSQEPYTIFLSVVSKCSSKRILTCSHVGVDQPWKNDKREGKTKQLVLLFRSSILSLLWFSDLSSSLKFVSGVRRRMRARAGAGGPLFPCSFFFFVVRRLFVFLAKMLVDLQWGCDQVWSHAQGLPIRHRLSYWWFHGEVRKRVVQGWSDFRVLWFRSVLFSIWSLEDSSLKMVMVGPCLESMFLQDYKARFFRRRRLVFWFSPASGWLRAIVPLSGWW